MPSLARKFLGRLLRHPKRPSIESVLGVAGSLYQPRFSPWLDATGFAAEYERIRPFTLVDANRSYVLQTLAQQALHVPGEFWECGVYRGGTAMLLGRVAASRQRTLRLFDTFTGMPNPDPSLDWHAEGDFSDTSVKHVRTVVSYEHAVLCPGLIPMSFLGREHCSIALAHVDVDLYQSVLDCCRFIYPRLSAGGFLVFDDYGWPTCAGARRAVDEYFAETPERPLVLENGQAIVWRLQAAAPERDDAR